MANEATVFYKRLASCLAMKWDQSYSSTLSWLRCRLTFSLLRSAIQCVRGARSSCGHAAKSPPRSHWLGHFWTSIHLSCLSQSHYICIFIYLHIYIYFLFHTIFIPPSFSLLSSYILLHCWKKKKKEKKYKCSALCVRLYERLCVYLTTQPLSVEALGVVVLAHVDRAK